MTTYAQVFNYLLQIQAADENITDKEDDNTAFTRAPNKTLSKNVEDVMAKTF